MSDSLSPGRLVANTVLTLVAMVVWLIVDANLWETSARETDRHKKRLYNIATVLTLSAGVLCCYVALLVVSMGRLPSCWLSPLESALAHPVDAANYLRLAAFVTAAATVGRALGSGFHSDEAVRRTDDANALVETSSPSSRRSRRLVTTQQGAEETAA